MRALGSQLAVRTCPLPGDGEKVARAARICLSIRRAYRSLAYPGTTE